MKAGKNQAPATEPKTDTDEPRPIPRDEEKPEAAPASGPVAQDDRALSFPPRSRMSAGKDNSLRIEKDNSVRVPAVDFVDSDKPVEEMTDMEQLEHLERIGKVWAQRQRLRPDPAEQE